MSADIQQLREQLARLEAAQANPEAPKLEKNNYAVVGSTAESDRVERLVAKIVADSDGVISISEAVGKACKQLGVELATHDIPEGSVGPMVVIIDKAADEAAQQRTTAAATEAADLAKLRDELAAAAASAKAEREALAAERAKGATPPAPPIQ